MPKKCQAPGCDFQVWSNGYCSYHQYKRTDEKWLKKKDSSSRRQHVRIKNALTISSKKKGYVIPRLSVNACESEKLFKNLKCRMIERELKAKGHVVCRFCLQPIAPDVINQLDVDQAQMMIAGHHLVTRSVKKFFLNEDNIWLAHHLCHTGGWKYGTYIKGFHQIERDHPEKLPSLPYIGRMLKDIGKFSEYNQEKLLNRLLKYGYKPKK